MKKMGLILITIVSLVYVFQPSGWALYASMPSQQENMPGYPPGFPVDWVNEEIQLEPEFQTDVDFPSLSIGPYNFFFSTIQNNTYFTSAPIPLEGDLAEYLKWKSYQVGDWDKFEDMVQSWIQEYPDVLEKLGITDLNEIIPNQAAMLAVEIVMDMIDYDYEFLSKLKQGVASGSRPYYVEEILESGKGVCGEYSEAVSAVFDEIKKLYPKNLKNSYMQQTFMGNRESLMHGYNALYTILEDGKVIVSLLDATWSDGNYALDFTDPATAGYNARLSDFIDSLFSEGLITKEQALSYLEEFLSRYPDHRRAVASKIDIQLAYVSRLESITYLLDIITNYGETNYARYATLTLKEIIQNYIYEGEDRSAEPFTLSQIGKDQRRLKEMKNILRNLSLPSWLSGEIEDLLRDIENDIDARFIATVDRIIRNCGVKSADFPEELAQEINEIFVSKDGLNSELVFRHFAEGIARYIEKGYSKQQAFELVKEEIDQLASSFGDTDPVTEEQFLTIADAVRQNVLFHNTAVDLHSSAPEWAGMDEMLVIEELAWKIMQERGLGMSTEGYISQIERLWESINKLSPELGQLVLKWAESPDSWQSWAEAQGIKVNDDGTITVTVETGASRSIHGVRIKGSLAEFGVVEDMQRGPSTMEPCFDSYYVTMRITPENLLRLISQGYVNNICY